MPKRIALAILIVLLGAWPLSMVRAATSTSALPTTVSTTVSTPVASVSSTVPTVVATSSVGVVFDPVPFGITSAYVMTPKTRRELYAYNADASWSVASLTKLASAMLWAGQKTVPWKRVVSLLSKDEVGGGRLRVNSGTRITFEDLWYASITASANNAAMALARNLGMSPAQYTRAMNAQAKRLKLKHTTFVDASGMSPENRSTAKEMAYLSDAAFAFRPLQKAASTAMHTVKVVSPKPHNRVISSTNDLLKTDPDVWVIAGKTGYLPEAGHSFVAWMRPTNVDGTPINGKDVLVVVFGAPTKERSQAAAKALAQATWSSHAFSRR